MITFGRWVRPSSGTNGVSNGASTLHPTLRKEPAGLTAGIEGRPERECLDACREVQEACLKMVAYSVRLQGYYAELGHVRLLEDCARVCELTQDFLLRGSEIRRSIAGFCAEVCERCAQDCERFDYDQRLLSCAAACRRCAEACQQLLELPIATELGSVA